MLRHVDGALARTAEQKALRWLCFGWAAAWLALQISWLYENHAIPLERIPSKIGVLKLVPANGGLVASLLAFAGVVLLLHALFAWLNLDAFRRLVAPRIAAGRTRLLAQAGQLAVVTLALSLVNAWYYDTSISGHHLSLILLQPSGTLVAGTVVVATVLYFLLWALHRVRTDYRFRLGAAFLLIASAGLWMLDGWPEAHGATAVTARNSGADVTKPDVIVIGFDSLRPDHLRKFGAPFSVTPNLDALLATSVIFSDTLTTQPHTFPATVSILTGQWPTNNGARGNLFPPKAVLADNSIAHDFRKAGYSTVLAMDETRFANIDQSYGFDTLVGPEIGLMDFLTSVIADNVLVNLIANTRAGAWLFPTIYGNRPVDYAYRPASFSAMVDDAIEAQPGNPLFLYAHFCSAHWPYRVRSLYRDDRLANLLQANYSDSSASYLRGLAEVDTQLGHLFSTLSQQGRLKNAIVVLLSDHGEDFAMVKDAVSVGAKQDIVLQDKTHGHGGSATRAPQVQVLLAFQRFGGKPFARGVNDGPATLVDIAPTLAHLAQLPATTRRFDGISLAPEVHGEKGSLDPQRIRYVESSYFPKSLDMKIINAGQAVEEMGVQFKVTAEGRVELRPEFMDLQIDQRQRAAYQGKWALVTSEMGDTTVLVPRRERDDDPVTHSPSNAPSVILRNAICRHWAKDAAFAERMSCSATPPNWQPALR